MIFIAIEIVLCLVLIGFQNLTPTDPLDNPKIYPYCVILSIFIVYMGIPYLIAVISARNKHFHTVAFVIFLIGFMGQIFDKVIAPTIYTDKTNAQIQQSSPSNTASPSKHISTSNFPKRIVNKTNPQTDALSAVTLASIASPENSAVEAPHLKVNLSCDLSVYCNNVPVKIRGIQLSNAEQTKLFIKDFFNMPPISLLNCGRDQYFNLYCDLSDGYRRNLAKELLKAGLATPSPNEDNKPFNTQSSTLLKDKKTTSPMVAIIIAVLSIAGIAFLVSVLIFLITLIKRQIHKYNLFQKLKDKYKLFLSQVHLRIKKHSSSHTLDDVFETEKKE